MVRQRNNTTLAQGWEPHAMGKPFMQQICVEKIKASFPTNVWKKKSIFSNKCVEQEKNLFQQMC